MRNANEVVDPVRERRRELAALREMSRVASEIEQTAEYGSSPEGEPQWRREHVDTLRQWAKRLRGEA